VAKSNPNRRRRFLETEPALQAAPAIPRGEPGGIGNGLCSIDIRMLDGGNTG